jgi:hypothetical protein
MAVAAFIVSIVSAAIALGSLKWARVSAKATERSAAAQERQADAAQGSLALDRARAGLEDRDRDEQAAPRFEIVGYFVLAPGGPFTGKLKNVGPSVALLESVTLHYPGGTKEAQLDGGPPVRVGIGEETGVLFRWENVDTLSWDAQPLELDLVYRTDASDYKAAARFKLLRSGADHRDYFQWRAGESRVARFE